MRHRDFGLLYCDPARATPGVTLFSPLLGKASYIVGLGGDILHQWEHPLICGTYAYLLDHGNLLWSGRLPEGPPSVSSFWIGHQNRPALVEAHATGAMISGRSGSVHPIQLLILGDAGGAVAEATVGLDRIREGMQTAPITEIRCSSTSPQSTEKQAV